METPDRASKPKVKSKHPKRIIIALRVFAAVLVVFSAFFLIPPILSYNSGEPISLYYFNAHTNSWHIDSYYPKQADTDTPAAIVSAILDRLRRAPENVTGCKTLPRGLILSHSFEYSTNGGMALIYFSDAYDALTLSEKGIITSSIVYSLTSAADITSVYLQTAGGSAAYTQPLTRESLALSAEGLPSNIGSRTVTLYFADAALTTLVAAERSITLHPNKSTENHVIEELIAGPASKDLARLIPADARLRGNVRVDGSICYVDFASDFLTRLDSASLSLTVYSIVNTLLDNTNAMQVQLLFAGDKSAAVLDGLDLGKPLSRY